MRPCNLNKFFTSPQFHLIHHHPDLLFVLLAADQDWLHKANKDVTKCWRQKRKRHQTAALSSRTAI